MTATIQRPLKGSRISTFYPVKELPPLASLDSAFQLQEYISLLVRKDPHDVEAITSLPGQASAKDASADAAKGEDADKAKSEVTVDQWCWVYEQIRRLAQDLTQPLITTLQQECTRASCPEMKAGEWLYLCVAHGNEGSMEQCCAIDYILHTLDSATALLNSPRAFPSRIQIPESSQRHFASLARRLGRIFAHAYFHHREAFEQAEAESALYARFLALSSKFDLVPAEFLPIPPEAIHPPSDDQDEERHPRNVQAPKLLGAGATSQFANSGGDGDGEQRQYEQQEQLKSILRDSQEGSYLEPPARESSASPNPPGLASPRRAGRNRTDTMVFSDAEAQSFAEQLSSRSGDSPEEPSPSDASPSQDGDALTAAEAAGSKEEEEPTPMEVDLVDLTDAEISKVEEEIKTEAPATEALAEASKPTEALPVEGEAEAEPQPNASETESKGEDAKETTEEAPSQPTLEAPETTSKTEDTAEAAAPAATATADESTKAPSKSDEPSNAPSPTPTPDDAKEKDELKETTGASS